MKYPERSKMGWLYILANPSTPYLKLGFTTDNVNYRARQISKIENKEFKFKPIEKFFVENPRCAETKVHEYFADQRIEREFFDVHISEVIDFIEKYLCPINHMEYVRNLLEGRERN